MEMVKPTVLPLMCGSDGERSEVLLEASMKKSDDSNLSE